MKAMNLKVFGMLLALQVSGAVLAGDPIIEQINVTQDAVKVAQEELQQGKLDIQPGADTDLKLTRFSEEASKALVRFEEAVRIRVLQSFSVLVSQYERTYKNKSLGTARDSILENLLKQIQSVQADKSQIYREAYLELYSVLPDLPITFDHETASYPSYKEKLPWAYTISRQNNSACMNSLVNCDRTTYYSYTGTIYRAKSKSQEFKFERKDIRDNKESSILWVFSDAKVFTLGQARTILLEDCYTSVCYFMTQSRFTIWKTMVEASLSRDIVIPLVDGRKIVITKDVNRNGATTDVLGPYMNNISTEGLINNLPTEASPERIGILTQMNAHLKKDSCSKARKLGETLCQATREGCLNSAEVALFKDRFGSDASCLK